MKITFNTDVCMVSDQDTLVSGPGQDADGAPLYVDLDATSPTQGGLTIEMGTDQKFSGGDSTMQAGDFIGGFQIESDGQDVKVTADFAGDDGSVVGVGTLAVNCA